MSETPLPLIILAGSDSASGPVPAGMTEQDMLRGYKAATMLPNGKSLGQSLVDEARASGCFDPVIVLGPRSVYEQLVDCEIVDVSGKLPVVLERLRGLMAERFDPASAVAACAGDILPSAEEFCEQMDSYRTHAGSSFWWQLVDASDEQMGASGWKQTYRLRPTCTSAVVPFYPGHLVVIRPEALRLRLLNHLLGLSYRFRTLVISRRLLPMVVFGGGRLLWQDILNIFRGQLPTLTMTVLYHSLTALNAYRSGTLSIEGFADRIGRLVVHRRFRHDDCPPAVVFSTSTIASFAKDFDSHIELEELIARLGAGTAQEQ